MNITEVVTMSNKWSKGSDTRWRTFRLTILERDKWTCRIASKDCTTRAEHVDHIIPLYMGGAKYDPANCRASCASCNLSRRDAVHPEPEPRQVSAW